MKIKSLSYFILIFFLFHIFELRAENIFFDSKNLKIENGILSDVAPTLLDLMKIRKPNEMTGRSLLKK